MPLPCISPTSPPQMPKDLDGAVTRRLAALVVPGQAGPVVDVDALLMLLVNEFNEGNCPRNALLFPRRVTDGHLFNIFNAAGHSPYMDDANLQKTIAVYISTQPPTSKGIAIKASAAEESGEASRVPSASGGVGMRVSMTPASSAGGVDSRPVTPASGGGGRAIESASRGGKWAPQIPLGSSVGGGGRPAATTVRPATTRK